MNYATQHHIGNYQHTRTETTTAKVSAPQIKDDAVEYKFESVMGTKG